jgi:hypothetical protein
VAQVGLMLDPMTHIAFAFAEAQHYGHHTRRAKLTYALSTIGISVLAGSVSTTASCAVLFLTTISIFSQFAALFCSLMSLTLLYALAFLTPLLLLAGPVQNGGMCVPRGMRRRSGSRTALAEADAAASTTWTGRDSATDSIHEVELRARQDAMDLAMGEASPSEATAKRRSKHRRSKSVP